MISTIEEKDGGWMIDPRKSEAEAEVGEQHRGHALDGGVCRGGVCRVCGRGGGGGREGGGRVRKATNEGTARQVFWHYFSTLYFLPLASCVCCYLCFKGREGGREEVCSWPRTPFASPFSIGNVFSTPPFASPINHISTASHRRVEARRGGWSRGYYACSCVSRRHHFRLILPWQWPSLPDSLPPYTDTKRHNQQAPSKQHTRTRHVVLRPGERLFASAQRGWGWRRGRRRWQEEEQGPEGQRRRRRGRRGRRRRPRVDAAFASPCP